MSRSRKDANLIVTLAALAAAGATVNSDALDTESSAPGVALESVELEISVPALANLDDDKDATFVLQDSADGVTFADIDSLASLVVTGSGGTGSDATSRTYKLPSGTRRYIRVSQTTEASGGDITSDTAEFALLF